jgi:predicted TIM-barrel fold metal-dependent hydrolase
MAAEAGVPVVFHVGGTGQLLDPNYFNNGLPVPPDFHGGAENFRSVDYMAIPVQPAQSLATMIFDGVFERFPTLKVGVIEMGAIWVPSWMRQMESAMDAFSRHEDRLKNLSLRPSEYVKRQMRFTPYPTEDVGWIIEQAGAEVPMFSSDYPHVEGGRRPIERFETRQHAQHARFDLGAETINSGRYATGDRLTAYPKIGLPAALAGVTRRARRQGMRFVEYQHHIVAPCQLA